MNASTCGKWKQWNEFLVHLKNNQQMSERCVGISAWMLVVWESPGVEKCIHLTLKHHPSKMTADERQLSLADTFDRLLFPSPSRPTMAENDKEKEPT